MTQDAAIDDARPTADAVGAAAVAEVAAVADIDAVRTALLLAVSHDLRTPLAAIKAMISGLRDTSVTWRPAQLAEALQTVEEETDRLDRLVGNLLDASRLQIGTLAVDLRAAMLSDVAAAALRSLNSPSGEVEVCIASDTPPVRCDARLLERSVANVVANAIRHSPAGEPARIESAVVGEHVHLRILDRGPGIAATERHKVLAPFQRLGDQHTTDGVGLGLSIAQGFVDAMAGTFTLDDTPGGGLTVTIILPTALEVAA